MAVSRIKKCPDGTHKCVSTLDTQEYAAMEPVPFTGSVEQARAAVDKVVADFPRTSVQTDQGDYVSAIFKTMVFRFKDTVEFEIDADAKLIHFRSESVPFAGSDLGANRKRMTKVRERLTAALG